MNFVLIKLKQNNSCDLKDVLYVQEIFCRYFCYIKCMYKKIIVIKKKIY